MKVSVDKEGCISCGICVNTCPEVFQFDEDDKSEVISEPTSSNENDVQTAADSCPASVIHVD